MKADLILLWHPELPSQKAARAARRFVACNGLQKVRASCLLRRASFQSVEDWYAGADLLDVEQVDLLRGMVSCLPPLRSQDIVVSLAMEEGLLALASTTPQRSFDAPPWSSGDASALHRGLPAITLTPRLAARPRARLCC